MTAATICLNCSAGAVKTLVAFGPLPPSNRYVQIGIPDPDSHSLNFGQCVQCGLPQLLDPMPVSMVRSRHAWLSYNEPERHLDALVEHLKPLIRVNSRIVGLTYNDDSTLARFNRLGYAQTFRYDMKADFGIDDSRAGLETIQSVIDDGLVDRLAVRHGKADLLVVRYLLEHAHTPRRFLRALGRLLAPGGRLVLEVPDCSKFIEACDYSSIWEEHVCYYSPRTVTDLIGRNGFSAVETLVYEYPLEDSLVVIVEATAEPLPAGQSTLERELAAGRRFSGEFEAIRVRYRSHFESLRKAGKRIALFGAGHFAAMFLNLFGLNESVDCVIDDNPHKQGLAMPGSGLPIVGSARLSEIDLCMLSVSPESEEKVIAKNRAYVEAGGRFASIFARSPLALKFA